MLLTYYLNPGGQETGLRVPRCTLRADTQRVWVVGWKAEAEATRARRRAKKRALRGKEEVGKGSDVQRRIS